MAFAKNLAEAAEMEEIDEDAHLLDTLARDYREWDTQEKQAKKEKETLRGPFMAAMTAQVMQERKPQKEIVTVTADEVEPHGDIRSWASFHYPGHIAVNLAFDGKAWTVILEENLELTKYEFELDGYKFGRSVSMIGAEFKVKDFDEWLNSMEAEEAYSEETLDALANCVIEKQVVTYDFDEKRARELLAKNPELQSVFSRFSYQGKPQVKFLPVTKAKTEEQQEVDG